VIEKKHAVTRTPQQSTLPAVRDDISGSGLWQAIDYYKDHRQKESEKLKSVQKKEVLKLAKDFPRLWKNHGCGSCQMD
jgi:hypothetical protein